MEQEIITLLKELIKTKQELKDLTKGYKDQIKVLETELNHKIDQCTNE
jgi:hypothetical protein